MFAWGERLLGQGGKERALSRLNKEAMLTLKYLHPHLTHTANGAEEKLEYVCVDAGREGPVRGIKQHFVPLYSL